MESPVDDVGRSPADIAQLPRDPAVHARSFAVLAQLPTTRFHAAREDSAREGLEGELFGHILRGTCLLRHPFFPGFVPGVGDYENSLRQIYRAGVLTAAAAGADIGFSLWLDKPVFVRHHSHCLGRTDLRAGPAIGSIGEDHAAVLVEFNRAHLHPVFLGNTERLECAGRADLRTLIALPFAVRRFIIHHRLQKAGDPQGKERGLQDMGRTDRDTGMAGYTTANIPLLAAGPRRQNGETARILGRSGRGRGSR